MGADLASLSGIAAVKAMRERQFSAVEYARALLEKSMAAADLRAFVAIDADGVLAAARIADNALLTGQPLGPLHGAPLAVKDNIDVAGLPTAAGTPALRGNIPTTNAPVVERLVAAGASVLGKTNMHELACGATTNNAAFGAARNCYDRDRVPGGSSGGTGAAVGARLTPWGLGTDTGGSVRHPAALCGVVGFRPTSGSWSQAGVIGNSSTRDTVGPMARDVADCALLHAIVTDTAPELPQVAARSLRLGVPRGYLWSDLDSDVAAVLEDRLGLLEAAGIDLVEAEIEDAAALTAAAGFPIGMYEHRATLTRYLAEAGSPITCDEVVAQVASPDVARLLATWADVPESVYRTALGVHRPALQEAYRRYFIDNTLDAIVFPTSPIPAPKISESDQIMHNGRLISTLALSIRNTDPGSVAGIPGMSLPAGLTTSGLPVGLGLDGPAGTDTRLLAIAQAIEALLPRTPPPDI